MKRNFKEVKKIIDSNPAAVKTPFQNNLTTLHVVAVSVNDQGNSSQDLEMYLLKKNASLTAVDTNGCTPIHFSW